jgi:predicted dehydrogenase
MPDRLKYACIGAGRIADKKHLDQYSKLNEVEVVAICDPDGNAARKLASKYHINHIYEDYHDLFKNHTLDLVSICAPNFLHAQICQEALQAGCHVHCEKPLALNAAEVKAIIDAKNKSKRKLMVALNNRFTAEAALIKRLADSNFFGAIYHVKCGWERNSGIPGIGKWFTNKELSGGGPLIDLGVHFLDLALYFMSYPQPLSVYGATYSNFGTERARIKRDYWNVAGGVFNVEDTAVGLIRLVNDATIDIHFSWAANIERDFKHIELLGTKGGVSFKNGEIKLYTQKAETCYQLLPDVKTIPPSQNEFQHFVKCIIDDREPDASPEQAYELMKIIDALYTSAEIKKEVVLL